MAGLEETLSRIDFLVENSKTEELARLYTSSRWYSVRYKAGKKLGVKDCDLRSEITIEWFDEIRKGLEASLNTANGRKLSDTDTRINSLHDLEKLYSFANLPVLYGLLQHTYDWNDDPEVVKEAGRVLGYSSFKIWLHLTFRKCKQAK